MINRRYRHYLNYAGNKLRQAIGIAGRIKSKNRTKLCPFRIDILCIQRKDNGPQRGTHWRKECVMAEVLKVHIPQVLKSGDAKARWKQVMDGAAREGQVYVVTGTSNKAVIVMGLRQFEELQESYKALAEELEARKALEKEEIKAALENSFENSSDEELPRAKEDFVTASKAEERGMAAHKC